ncbi:homoserine dehydrogenase [Arenimonas sp.]|uniref:homoserine dehydrogenase n=1 Tax=Arenimonas sp. TaxID=1872635 RepID=UPI0035AF3C26
MSTFAEPRPAPVPRRLALLGVGTVGRALLARLQAEPDPRRPLCLVANSRRRLHAPQGLDPAQAAAALAGAPAHDGSGLLLPQLQPGDIVVDASASATLAAWHPRWLRQGLHVVSANKLGLGGPLLRHHEIRALATGGLHYGDAATVGAGLPLLRSLRELRAGGDRIRAVAGVLSGTLAWLFDGYDGGAAFSDKVRAAVARGYAEPDPRVDLSGEDVRRKLLILARTAGFPLEHSEVQVESLLGDALREAPDAAAVDGLLPTLDATLSERACQAARAGRVLRYVARLDEGGARVGLEALAANDPLAGGGCDNRLAIWSSRYDERPLVIQGPGAGAAVTAAALLDDLRRIP